MRVARVLNRKNWNLLGSSLQNKLCMVCPFCRAEDSTNDKEFLKRLWERIDEHNDPKAMNMMGNLYVKGDHLASPKIFV